MTVTRRQLVLAAGGALAVSNMARVTRLAASPVEEQRVRIVTGLRATVQSLGWIGMEAGVFRRLGLDVSFPALEIGGPEAELGLARGRWEFAETGSSPVIQGVVEGRDSVIVLVPSSPPTSGAPILARPHITTPAQLEGARIGVLTETGQVTITVRAVLRQWGVTATLVPLGTFGNIYAALGSGQVDAGALPIDYRFRGPREFGLAVLDTPALGFQSAVVATSRRMIETNRTVVARLVQAYVETIHFFKTNPAEVVPLLQRFLEFPDRRAVEDAWAHWAPRLQPTPRPATDGIRALLHELAPRFPAARTLAPAAVVDTSFLDDLERSGFVKRLYGH